MLRFYRHIFGLSINSGAMDFRPANVLSLSRHVPSGPRGATHSVAPSEPRKRRANERHVVGCCEELGGAIKHPDSLRPGRCKNRKRCAERRKYGVWQHYVRPEEHMAPSACSPIDCLIAA